MNLRTYYVNALKRQMVDAEVTNFNKRVSNLCLAYDLEKAFSTIDVFCKLSSETIHEINDPDTKRFISDLVKQLFLRQSLPQDESFDSSNYEH